MRQSRMELGSRMSIAFNNISSGLADAIAYAAGDATKGRVAAGPDVKAIPAKRKKTFDRRKIDTP